MDNRIKAVSNWLEIQLAGTFRPGSWPVFQPQATARLDQTRHDEEVLFRRGSRHQTCPVGDLKNATMRHKGVE